MLGTDAATGLGSLAKAKAPSLAWAAWTLEALRAESEANALKADSDTEL